MNIFSFGERILLEYYTRDVVLSNSMARPMKLRCVFSKVFLGFVYSSRIKVAQ